MPAKKKENRIFISWSGEISKEIAKALKICLEKEVFPNTDFSCFVSDVDIASGADWWNKIKRELKSCKMGVLCITKENLKAPWIYYEAGAMVAQEIPTIPLLISCNIRFLQDSPLKGNQCVNFYTEPQFVKMLLDINNRMHLLNITEDQQRTIYSAKYNKLKLNLEPYLKKLTAMRLFNEKYIYPNHVSVVKKSTIYICVPMSCIDETEYLYYRDQVIKMENELRQIGFTDVICPMINIENKSNFDGKTKAIKENFANLKQVDSMIVIYPRHMPSSILVELGYGIALSKRIVIFYKDNLPYIVEKSGETMEHVKTYKYDNISDVNKIINSDGMALFEGGNDE